MTNDDDGNTNLWLQRAEEYFKQKIIRPSFYIEEAFGRTVEEVQEFFLFQAESIMASVPIRSNCAQVLTELWEQGHTIQLITARDEKYRSLTEAWLKKHMVPYHDLHMSPAGQVYCKGERCVDLNIEFFVDDKFENVVDVAKYNIYTSLFNASHNKDYNTDLPRVSTWLEIYEQINFLLHDTLSASSR